MQKLIYLDNNATTTVDPRVLEAMLPVFSGHFGNPASGSHPYGWYAEELVEIAREQVAQLIAARPEEIVFTSGATEANNLAIKGVAAATPKDAPRRIISVNTEHKSVLDPLQSLAAQGWEIELLQVDSNGGIEVGQFEEQLLRGARLVSIMLANNETGTLHDIATLAAIAKEHNVLFHCDATQAVGKIPVSMQSLGDVDFLSCSAHKFYGPKGIGALYVRSKSRRAISPLTHGGGHEGGLRSGTLNVPGIVGMGAAAQTAGEELPSSVAHGRRLEDLLLRLLREQLDDVELNTPEAERLPGTLSLRLSGVDSARLIGMVNTKVAFSNSSACQSKDAAPSHVLKALGLSPREQRESFRLGIGRFSTEEQIEEAAAIIASAAEKIRKNSRH